jgi:hypothetical protein
MKEKQTTNQFLMIMQLASEKRCCLNMGYPKNIPGKTHDSLDSFKANLSGIKHFQTQEPSWKISHTISDRGEMVR